MKYGMHVCVSELWGSPLLEINIILYQVIIP